MYSLSHLGYVESADFSGLTFPSLRPLLVRQEHRSQIVALGARACHSPIGLALAEINEESQVASIRSVAVLKEYRCQGIGTGLFAALEKELRARQCVSAQIHCVGDQGPSPEVARLLKKSGWPKLEPKGIFCQSDYDTLSRAPWMKYRSVPAGFEIFAWKDLTHSDREKLLDQQPTGSWYPKILDPFNQEYLHEPITSLGLRYRGSVIGWCLAQRLSFSGVACTNLYVRKEFQIRGFAIRLLVNAIELSRGTGMKDFFFDVAFNKANMIAFVRSRMLPYLKSVRVLNMSRKPLLHHAAVLGASA